MESAKTEQHYINCPNCNARTFNVEHLLKKQEPTSFGEWVCDKCGTAFQGKIAYSQNGEPEIQIEITGIYCSLSKLILLKLDLLKSVAFFIIEATEVTKVDVGVQNLRFSVNPQDAHFYEQYTCPTNFISVLEIIENNDTDPHGLFQYLGTLYLSDDETSAGYFENRDFQWWDSLFCGALSEELKKRTNIMLVNAPNPVRVKRIFGDTQGLPKSTQEAIDGIGSISLFSGFDK